MCGSDKSRVLFESGESVADDEGNFEATTDKFGPYGTVRKCLRCGLAYTSPRRKDADILAGYRRTADQEYATECDSRSMNACRALARIRRHARGGRLLEVGCSTGYFLKAAQNTYEVTGVEPSAWSGRYAREKLGLEIAASTLQEAHFPDDCFDVVALIDVIEHVTDPLGMMREVARVVRDDGIVYLVTPDIGSLSARVLRGKWWGLRPAHIYYFSRKTLRALLNAAGFDVLEMHSYGRIFTWRYWLSRLTNYPRPVCRLVERVIQLLRVDDKFLYLNTRDSVQVIARKRPS